MADKDQKTEDPTSKRLSDARKKGDVITATEFRHAVMLVAVLVLMGSIGTWTLARLGTMFVRLWGNAEDYRLEPTGAQNFAFGIAEHFALAMMPAAGVVVVFALLTSLSQGKPTFAVARLKPKFSKLSPMNGLGRMFSTRSLVDFVKTVAKCAAVIIVATMVLRPKLVAFDQLVGSEPQAVVHTINALVYSLIKAVAMMVAVIAFADFFYQRRAWFAKMRMSKQEIKDEYRQQEGDPKVKGRIRSIQRQRSRQRMMAAVPTASVVITNPTHYAVALKYEHGEMAAPVVVAKGADEVALRIRAVATENKVPIVESPPLARALFASADIDRPIPVEHYAAVAEVIGYVMRLARSKVA
ncbi:flagellar biosynthesis protein FlhB [Sphingomonas quercus]|uniref:Flagellar biosynthetic protein FlhB n=1 Tax=Sphingomonas quercus TaxID=2842451 RepID=A0ABS6BJZ0_9SPHN|nr:flagellar biosynthesis protein FlhB [Sphingomonas quercus]MBU3078613.1 flagellar biosynthesis protein FlhB [Sphingomonas quercus]